MDFPQGKFDYEMQTTINFFKNKIINVKIHLHHSHVTGKIYGYMHDFCNMEVRENKDQFSCIARNLFGFDMSFLVKGIRLSVWGTKDINIGRSRLTNSNFASISSQVKFIDTMKYFLTSLGQLASTLDKVEKAQVEKLTVQFLNQHSYFSRVWRLLSEPETREVLDIIVSGKGVIPYEKINSIDSLNIKLENGILFSKDEFYSMLKGKAAGDDEYENSKELLHYVLCTIENERFV